MHLPSLLLCLSLGAIVKYAAASDWCYTGCDHSPGHWGDLSGSHCGENRQSPINIDPHNVHSDPKLGNFNLTNFDSPNTIKSMKIDSHTVKLILEDNEVEVSGGGLNGTYSTIQFHFHWGNKEHHPGSEHTIEGHRYPMEMHIVSLKKGYTAEQAVKDSEGIAVLGFLINATEDGNMSGPWDMLTSNLTGATGNAVDVNLTISIDDLIGDVNLTKFYRYMGSLTTPNCNEAVVWTVFQEPININKELIQRFPTKTGVTDVYRPVQKLNGRKVYASPATPLPPSHSFCYDDHCAYSPSHWSSLPLSHCAGERQSPIDIVTNSTVTDDTLGAFTYKKFDDKHTIKYITNTGHAVKCVLKEDTVEVSGGGLEHVYSTLQFHFHWGSTAADSKGSEHTVDNMRYPMEMHIVSKRKDLSLEDAVEAPDGLAVLGFFIEPTDSTKSSSSSGNHETTSTSDKGPWEKLTNYLLFITNINSRVDFTEEISIDDLLGSVNREAYYRYNGSLTTPSCNEAVIWTVFQEPVKVDKDLMKLFPTLAGYTNVFRPRQNLHSRAVLVTKSASSAPGPIMLLLLLACLGAFSFHL
ncbi:carbonic anhydrase 4-like isoform X2 [Centropristis striata]|nr:carbonic anhydrase 4-like isoform X2 [Centropristis striata]XP_059181263.1 carbonic anhydrase 4-like isoform X2 [Centropristis striata]XP_059181264.1 carbonic anhydrase 4-like isoform X2 [Centropristis striata]